MQLVHRLNKGYHSYLTFKTMKKFIKNDLMWCWLISIIVILYILVAALPAFLAIVCGEWGWWFFYLIEIPLFWYAYVGFKSI
jgi:hypothetical protein